MSQIKDHHIQAHIEPTIYRAMQDECIKRGLSTSRFVRQSLIAKLRELGALTEKDLAAMSMISGEL